MGEMMLKVILFTLFLVALSQINGPTVVTNTGTFIGRDEIVPGQRRPIYSFRGIKYAEVRGRFFYSKYYEASRLETRNAISDGLPCPQPFMRPSEYSEDCLHLSVWSPSISTSSRKLPVLIYLTGSLWTLDTPDIRRLAPESLVSERNILVVTVSYRLNVFGFLSLEHTQVPGNMGLFDIFFALFWVRSVILFIFSYFIGICLSMSYKLQGEYSIFWWRPLAPDPRRVGVGRHGGALPLALGPVLVPGVASHLGVGLPHHGLGIKQGRQGQCEEV